MVLMDSRKKLLKVGRRLGSNKVFRFIQVSSLYQAFSRVLYIVLHPLVCSLSNGIFSRIYPYVDFLSYRFSARLSLAVRVGGEPFFGSLLSPAFSNLICRQIDSISPSGPNLPLCSPNRRRAMPNYGKTQISEGPTTVSRNSYLRIPTQKTAVRPVRGQF